MQDRTAALGHRDLAARPPLRPAPGGDSCRPPAPDMAQKSPASEVQLGPQGRLVIPAALRAALHLEPGDRLIARLEGEALVLKRPDATARRLQDRFRHIPATVSLVDELLAQRRAEAAKEAGLNLGMDIQPLR